jgi:hypothetical protein
MMTTQVQNSTTTNVASTTKAEDTNKASNDKSYAANYLVSLFMTVGVNSMECNNSVFASIQAENEKLIAEMNQSLDQLNALTEEYKNLPTKASSSAKRAELNGQIQTVSQKGANEQNQASTSINIAANGLGDLMQQQTQVSDNAVNTLLRAARNGGRR